jgi:predicted acetyltransferase
MEIRTRDEGRRHIRELRINEEVVSSLFVTDYQLRIGPVKVNMAGIGAVSTKEAHRMKGYSRRLLEDTMEYLQNRDYDVSMLFGIPDFYSKFQYIACMAEHQLIIQTKTPGILSNHRSFSKDLTIRKMEQEDIDSVIELYNHNHDQRKSTCSPVRYKEYFKSFLKGVQHGQQADCFILEDPTALLGARVLGYAAYDQVEPGFHVVEVESRDDRFFPLLMRECSRQAELRQSEKMIFYLPPDHPFVHFSVDLGCEVVSRYTHDSGGMMRIIHQQSFLEKLEGMFASNLDLAGLKFPGTLCIRTEVAETRITLEKNPQKQDFTRQNTSQRDIILDIPLEKLMQLAVGYRSIKTLLNDPSIKVIGDGAVQKLELFFSQAVPYLPMTERF